MAPVTPSRATDPRRSTRLRSKPADPDPDPDAQLERGASRGKRQRKSAGKAGRTHGSAAKDGPKGAEQPVGVGAMEVDDAGRAINDDICAEEPDTEEMLMGEEGEEEAAAAATGAEGSAETLGARKKRVARQSIKRRADASEDRFVGDPLPDGEARRRWPQRYKIKDSDAQAKRSADEDEEMGALRHYRSACVDDGNFDLGDDVYVKAAPGEDNYIGRITEFFEGIDHGSYFACRSFFRVADTVISPKLLEVDDHKHDHKRVFLSEENNDNMIGSIISKVNIIYVGPNITPEAKAQLISKCDLFYDMSYALQYSSFANLPPENGGATGSEATSDISCDDVDSSKERPIADLAAPPAEQMETATLLDLYSGCGAMSTGLCLGAALFGLKLNTKWAVDMNKRRADASEDRFVGDPLPDGEARQRWPQRYTIKDSDAQDKRPADADEEMGALRHYRSACVDDGNFDLGDDVYVKAAPGEDNYIGRITEFFEGIDHVSYFACRSFFRVADTVISPKLLEVDDHKHDHKRVFLSEENNDNMIGSIISKVNIIYVGPNITPEAKAQLISKCDLFYDMSYALQYSSFANLPPENGGATGSEATSDISCDDVDSSKERPIADLAAPPAEQMETATLLDLYSGCGAMSTGLCLGAALSGLKLNTDSDAQAKRSADADEEMGALRHYRSACVDDGNFNLGDDVYVKDPNEKIQLFVKLCGYMSISIQQNLSEFTVRKTVEIALKKGGFNLSDFKSEIPGKILNPEELLSVYRLQRDSTIFVSPRLRGGAMSQLIVIPTWNEVIPKMSKYEVVVLPDGLVDIVTNITDAYFVAPGLRHFSLEALRALARKHILGICFGGAISGDQILLDNGQARFADNIKPLKYEDFLAIMDYQSMFNILSAAFWCEDINQYPLHVEELLDFLLYSPADCRPNALGVIAYVTNHMALIPHMEKISKIKNLRSLIAGLNLADYNSLPMISTDCNFGEWPDLIFLVRELYNTYIYNAHIIPAAGIAVPIPKYDLRASECVRLSDNYFKHANHLQFSHKELEAALSLATNDVSFWPGLLRSLALRIDGPAQANTSGVQRFLDSVLHLLGNRTAEATEDQRLQEI